MFVTFVYGNNVLEDREGLWQELGRLASLTLEPWLVLGDFNNVLRSDDRLGGLSVTDAECDAFQSVLINSQLQELSYIGWPYTWCNRQWHNLIYSKIDRCFGNIPWFQSYGAYFS